MNKRIANIENFLGKLSYLPLIIFILFFLIANIYWVKENRFDQILDIDESGYISYSLTLQNSFKAQGLSGFLNALAQPVTFAPLVPAIASLGISLSNSTGNMVLLTNTFICALLFITIYQIGLIISGKAAAISSVLLAASIDSIGLHTRTFSFSISAALFFALAVLSFIKCTSFTNRKWSAYLGASLAFMILSRTMTLAFLPSFFIVICLSIHFRNKSTPVRIHFANLILAFASFILIAAPWYLLNFRTVFGYLFSFGFGKRASEYGSDLGFLTLENFFDRASRLADSYGLVPMLVLVLIFLLIVLQIKKHHFKDTKFKTSLIFQISILIAITFFTLFTSRNRGFGFEVPFISIISTILLSSFFNFYKSFYWRVLVCAGITTLYFGMFYFNFNTTNCQNLNTKIHFPFLGPKALLECHTPLHRYVAGFCVECMEKTNKKEPIFSKTMAIKWKTLNAEIADFVFKHNVKRKTTSFASRHSLMNVNSVQLELIKRHSEAFPFIQIEPNVILNSIDGYRDWILNTEKNNSCYIVLLNNNWGEFSPYPNIKFINNALIALNYKDIKQIETPTVGQSVNIWFKENLNCK